MTAFVLTVIILALFVWAVVATAAAVEAQQRAVDEAENAEQAIRHADECQDAYNEAEERAGYWRDQYHGGVDTIIARLRAQVAAQGEDTPIADRLTLDWLERETAWEDAP